MLKIFINPGQFNDFAETINRPLLILSILTLLIGLIIVFFISPDDYQQGSTVKIMYVHVPAAWISLMTFFIMTIYSILALAFKIPFGFIVNKAIAPIGATFSNLEVGEKITAVFIIIGSINLPIIKFSVDWWNTLHQSASISKLSSPSIDISMLIPLIIMTLAFIFIGLQIALIRIRSEILDRKLKV